MVYTEIIRKGKPIFVRLITVHELDKNKCSSKFLEHNLSDDTMVYVKSHRDGSFHFRGKKEEYRIIVPDNYK
jgi:hypothetical protein